MHWYLEPLRKYADFSGRARRREYWSFFLGNILIGILMGLLLPFEVVDVASIAFTLVILLPHFAVTVRRLHDVGWSGLWVLLGLVPLLGMILFIPLMMDSQAEPNRFGPNPKAEGPGTVPAEA